MIYEPGKTINVPKGKKLFANTKKVELMVHNLMGEQESEYAFTV